MKKVYQTERGRRGNCFAACVASILELPLGGMPEYLDEEGNGVPHWLDRWGKFLRPHGLGIVYIRQAAGGVCLPPPGYAIMAAAAPTAEDPENLHAVVCRDGEVVHDPLDNVKPNRGEYVPDHWYVFTALDPVRPLQTRATLQKIAGRRPCLAVANVAFYRSRQDAQAVLRRDK